MQTKLLDTFQPSALLKEIDRFTAFGYRAACLYYFRSSRFKERLTPELARAICGKGWYIVSVWENGQPTLGAYFSRLQGDSDGAGAAAEAERVGQPKGTPIYLAVDYDVTTADLDSVSGYFCAARVRLLAAGYTVGCYGSGKVLQHLTGQGVIEYSWLTQSKSFRGYQDFLAKANIVQGYEHSVFGLDIDEDTSAGAGGGWKV